MVLELSTSDAIAKSRSNGSYACNGSTAKDIAIESGETPPKKPHGYSVGIATLFVAGENAGCALLALPYAVMGTGWTGMALIILCGLNAAYAGVVLAKCWMILEERWPQFRGNFRYPYPAIGLMAFGPKMRVLVSVCMHFTLVGSCVVVLLICSELVTSLAATSTGICFCVWILIIAAILCPMMWFGTPSEFWPVAMFALLSTSIAVVLMVVNIWEDHASGTFNNVVYPTPDFKSVFLAFGTIMFAYGGTAAFPTFQNDMKNKSRFPTAVLFGFTILLVLYLPISASGYYVYGAVVKNDITLSIEDGTKKTIAQVLMAGHLFFAFLILANAPAQEFEALLKVPRTFSWKRICVRSLMMVAVVAIGETIPHFGKILNLLGGSTVALISFVFPPLFYIKLCGQSPDSPRTPLSFDTNQGNHWQIRKISRTEKAFLIQIICMGLFGGIACTYSALLEIVSPNAFTPPCYVGPSCKLT